MYTKTFTIRMAALALLVASGCAANDKPPALVAAGTNAVPSSAVPGGLGFFDLYALNRREKVPNLITADFLLLGYSLVRQQVTAEVEQEQVQPLLTTIVAGLSAALEKAPADDEVAQANRDFLALVDALLSGEPKPALSKRAQAELKLVLDAGGITPSPLWGRQMDYSQFHPRGRYTESAASERFFRAMRYAGSALLTVTPTQATGVSPALAERMARQALALAKLLQGDSEAARAYRELDALLAWQYGAGEDLTVDDVLATAKAPQPAKGGLAARLLKYARDKHRQPAILHGVVDKSRLEKGVTPTDALTGWRLLPLRYSADSAAMQNLVYDRVGSYQGDQDPAPFTLGYIDGKPVKGFPRVDEILGLLGSSAARQRVAEDGDNLYQGYDQAYAQAEKALEDAQGLTGAHLALLRKLVGTPAPQERAAEQRLTSAAAFWSWQRYLNLLYSKQSYTVGGKGLNIAPPRSGAALEQRPEVYRALSDLVQAQQEHTPHPAWEELAAVITEVRALADKQARGEDFDAGDDGFLNRLDTRLLAITGDKDHPVVVDVHTNPVAGLVLEEGVGYARAVVAPQSPARGAVFTHYEFKQPLAERLTDEAWEQMLRQGTASGDKR